MELMQLYNQIKNPLDDKSTLEKLVEVYSKSSDGFKSDFYSKLVKSVSKKYTQGHYYTVDSDEFYAMLFNKWKNSIVSMTKEQFIELNKSGSYDADFVPMREFLKTIPDIKTRKEAHDIIYGKHNNSEVENALMKYRWDSFGDGPGWTQVASRYLTAKKDPSIKAEHRLYIDTESVDTYKLLNILVKKFDQHNLPYYFKFDEYADRDDTIVIYATTELLPKYVELLKEIKIENPDLISRIKQPPLLTGKIDGWFGYGTEPGKDLNGEGQSFNSLRTKVIEPVMDEIIINWIMNHINMQINYQGEIVNFKDYIVKKCVEKLVDNYESSFKSSEKWHKDEAIKRGTVYSEKDLIIKKGYSLQDIKSSVFKENVFKIIKKYIDANLLTLQQKGISDVDNIKMTVRYDKELQFSKDDFSSIIRSLALNIIKNDPAVLETIKVKIKENANHYGIDPNNFSFDSRAVEKFKKTERQNNNIIENTNSNSQYNMDELSVQTITDIINPELMKKRLKLPNGVELSARQYIQEIVYPYLPSNGMIVLNDGVTLSVKQFIEECVMFECQEKYNGDFERYFAERTMDSEDNINIVSRKK